MSPPSHLIISARRSQSPLLTNSQAHEPVCTCQGPMGSLCEGGGRGALAENEVREEEPVNSTRRHRPESGRSLNSMIATRKIKCEAQSQTTSTERPREQDRTFTLLGYVLYWRVTCPWWSRAGPYAKYRLEYPVATKLWRTISWVSRNGVFP